MSRRFYLRFLLTFLLLLLLTISLPPPTSATLTVTAVFNQSGISGKITFTQETPGHNTSISVSLKGFGRFPADTFPFPWHVHEYPFPNDGTVTPCEAGVTGGHFDPLGAFQNPNYTVDCNMDNPQNCEVGDLGGKFENFSRSDPLMREYSDQFLSLYGVNSIIGRSIVIHFTNGSRLVCANIGYPNTPSDSPLLSGGLLYSPFRNNFTGSIFFRQHTADNSTSSVFTNLERIDGEENSNGHNWHVHRDPLDEQGQDCFIAGPHYNPRDVSVEDQSYSEMCGSANTTTQRNCEIGDLSNKGAPFDVVNRRIRQLYTDTDLPLLEDSDGYSIDNRSVVIHAPNRTGARIACANVTRFRPLEAVSVFNENGVIGSVRFSQRSPYDPTQVRVVLRGLGEMADGYHVHEYPVGPENLGSPGKCASRYTGGHWNPTNVTASGITSDQFEIGDLSGKFGGLSGLNQLEAVYTDPNIPLFGPFSVIGRSIVIHMADGPGTRWVCSDIQHTRQFIQITTVFSTASFSGNVTFIQLADDPYSETTVVVSIDVQQMLQPPVAVSSPVDMSTSTNAMTTNMAAMTTNNIAMTTSIQMTTNAIAMTTIPIVMSTSTVMMTSFPAPILRPSSSSVAPELPTAFTSRAILPEPTTSNPSPLTSSIVDDGNMIFPMNSDEISVSVSPTSVPSGRRRRRSSDGERLRRQAADDMTVPFEWSLRMQDGNSGTGGSSDCSALPVFSPYMSNSDVCSPTNQLACSSGDLTSKHGALPLPQQAGSSRTFVFTDPNLPLSGSGSTLMLLIQPVGAMTTSQNAVCTEQGAAMLVDAPIEPPPLTTAPPTTAPPTTAPPTTVGNVSVPQTDNTVVIIGAAVGGSVVVIVLVVLVVVIAAVCVKRRSKSGYDVAKSAYYELGTINHSKPILGIPNYKALYDYKPQNDDDLGLAIGDWVTLIETPLGGNWWRGSVEGRGEGWFPKNFVKYVDVEAEKKKREAENFKLAAAAIVAASTSFSTRHPSLSRKKREDTAVKPQRAHTFSRRDIDSTPKMVTKFDKPYLERIEPPDGTVITNAVASSAASSLPGTPISQRSASEVITNKVAMEAGESSGNSQEDNEANKESDAALDKSEFLMSEKYVAKYEFGGSTDIELQFKKGSTVTVIEKADNGWWKGICEGQVGWFPESYVRPVPKETKKPHPPQEEAVTGPGDIDRPRGMDETMASGGDIEATEYRAVFAYNSDAQGDLKFGEGETVLVYWADENGWWFGSAGSAQGWFPGSYVEPVVEVSEAGSILASPITEEAEAENDGSLGSQLAAAIKKRKSKKSQDDTGDDKDTRSSFRKRWSLRRKSRDKNKGSPSANRPQEESPSQKKLAEPALQDEQAEEERTEEGRHEAEVESKEKERLQSNTSEGGIQGELASAIVRRNSIGQEATLSIDERLARAKQQKDSEPQNELLNALKKHKVSVEQSSSAPEKTVPAAGQSPVEKQPVETVSSQENKEVSTKVLSEKREEIAEPHRQEEPKTVSTASSATPTVTSKEEVQSQAVKDVAVPTTPKTLEPESKPVSSVTSPAMPILHKEDEQHKMKPVAPPRTPESSARKSVAERPRRRPPPPPAAISVAVGTTPATLSNKVSPPQTASPSLRKISVPTPTIHEKSEPKTPTDLEVDRKSPISKTKVTPDTDKSGRSYTTAAALGGKVTNQPRGKPRPVKRLTSSSDLKPKYPARRPPPPPPGTVGSPPTAQQGQSSPSTTTARKVIASSNVNGEAAVGTPPGGKRAPPSRGTPVAPPRTKARVQKVKRPMSRMIPPPPNIPLPPPPARKTPPTASKNKVGGAETTPNSNNTTATQPQSSAVASSQSTSHPPVNLRKTSPKGPKPTPPTRVSSLTPEPQKKLRIIPQSPPATAEDRPAGVNKHESPPTRKNEVSNKTSAPVAAKRQQQPSSGEAESREETDAPLVNDSPLNRKASKSSPPERPPPPRPASVTSNASTRLQVNPDKPADSKPAKPERTPQVSGEVSPPAKPGSSDTKKSVVPLLSSSSQGKVLFDATAQQGSATTDDPGHNIKPKGGGFMKSLKKIVKRDSNVESSTPDHKPAPEAKTLPTGSNTSHKDTPLNGTAATVELKSPPPRPMPISNKDQKPTAEVVKSPPARPPPLKISTDHHHEMEPKQPVVSALSKADSPTAGPVVNGSEVPKPRPRKAEIDGEKVDKPAETAAPIEEKKDVKAAASKIPSRPPPPKTSPSEKKKINIPARPPPPKTPVSKSSPDSFKRDPNGVQSPSPTSIPNKPKPMPAPRKEVTTDLPQKSNGSINSAATPPAVPVPTPRQKSSSPPPDGTSPTNPTGTNFYRATKDYKANADGELSFSAGDVIIFMDRREKGFYYGMLDTGVTGVFPSSHVEPFFH